MSQHLYLHGGEILLYHHRKQSIIIHQDRKSQVIKEKTIKAYISILSREVNVVLNFSANEDCV